MEDATRDLVDRLTREAEAEQDVVRAITERFRLPVLAGPVPWRIVARHDVPYGAVIRMWDTRDRLTLYVHRSALMDAIGPRVSKAFLDSPYVGTPVYYE